MAAVDAPALAPGSWRAWWLAARPRTLPLGVAPVAVGTALAAADGAAHAPSALAALCGALLLQLGANFVNDYADGERGVDDAERVGPPRALQLGLLSARALRWGALLALAAAAFVGLSLVWRGGGPILVLGLVSIAAAFAYTGGPRPFGYRGLGDVAVFAFFGLAAVCGTYYVQALTIAPRAVIASVPVGALATAVLVVNNVRDLETDRRSGKRTLAVRLGPRGARAEYAGLVALAYAGPAALFAAGAGAGVALPLMTLPFGLRLALRVWRSHDGPELSEALAATAKLALAYAVLLALGILL